MRLRASVTVVVERIGDGDQDAGKKAAVDGARVGRRNLCEFS
jgi:hypothetical protein